jgi:hypothetical protein
MAESLKKLLIKKTCKKKEQQKMGLKSNRKKPNKDDFKKIKLSQKN